MVLSTRFVQEDAPKSNNFEAAQTTYLLYASDNNQNFKISKLDTDYYNVASQSLAGPWSSQADIAPSATRTYFSQNAFDYLINSNFAIYMGDRWRPSLLGSSRYIWYPLSWSSGVPQIVHADVWSLDLSAGAYTAVSGTTYEAESGTIGGSATTLSDSSFSGGKAIGYLGNGGSITINNVQGTGSAQWVALYYANGDSTWRNTTVRYADMCLPLIKTDPWYSVNGGASILVDQPNTGGGHVILSVPVKVNLNNGANSITVGSGQSSKFANISNDT
ncbi:hypothetical protein H0H87_010185 [Tephrocybe sp. NHM501043]|nr:hypothetical protein H0H87_010185 [Tephrocybe sp. NHM501043]